MKLQDLYAKTISDLEFAKSHYTPLFRFARAPLTALIIWALAMTAMFSMALDGAAPKFGEILSFGALAVLALMVIISVVKLISWDRLNGVIFTLEAMMSSLSFWLATYIPFAKNVLGRLSCITIAGFLISLILAYCIDFYFKRLTE